MTSLATIELLEEAYIENAADVGQYAIDALQEIQVRHPSIGDVRGKGLMIGIEFVKDKGTKEPNDGIRDMVEKYGFPWSIWEYSNPFGMSVIVPEGPAVPDTELLDVLGLAQAQ